MEELQKASHYRSYYEVAKKLTNPSDRLAFYDALDLYRFEGVLPEDLPPVVDIVITAILPIIDADRDRKKGGAPKGNHNAKRAELAEPAEEEPEPEPVQEPETKPDIKRFKKPTVDEVKAYCEERQNKIDPARFVDYYESRGWRTKSGPIKDWRACVRTWEHNETAPKDIKTDNPLPPDRQML